jgi:agmatine deiminase
VPDGATEKTARESLAKAHVDLEQVRFLERPLDRGWMRDCSPAFVQGPTGRQAVRFAFNAWAKYDDFAQDAEVAPFLAQATGSPVVDAIHGERPVVLEGGAIDSNGAGTLLTTEECLLDPEVQVRNPGVTREDYEAIFREYLGIEKVLWLGKGIAGDDTHGHVDDLCRFVNPSTVVLCAESNPDDENYPCLAENRERLEGATTATGEAIEVLSLPMPAPLYFDGARLPASYANFYIGNEAVLVPTFNDANDRLALGILAECFPDRRVVGIHAVDLVWGFGTVHCLSHEVPAAKTGL